MPYRTVRVEVGDERLAGREVVHLKVQQAVGAHAHLALTLAPTPAMRAAPAARTAAGSPPDLAAPATSAPATVPAAAAALLHVRVRVLLVDGAGAAHVAFAGRVAGVRSVRRPSAGRRRHDGVPC